MKVQYPPPTQVSPDYFYSLAEEAKLHMPHIANGCNVALVYHRCFVHVTYARHKQLQTYGEQQESIDEG